MYKELIIEQEEILNEEIPENEEMKNPEEEDNIEIEIVEGQEETDSTIKDEESNILVITGFPVKDLNVMAETKRAAFFVNII